MLTPEFLKKLIVSFKLSSLQTGILFNEQTPEALISAVEHFEKIENSFDPEMLVIHAKQYDKINFIDKLGKIINEELKSHGKNGY